MERLSAFSNPRAVRSTGQRLTCPFEHHAQRRVQQLTLEGKAALPCAPARLAPGPVSLQPVCYEVSARELARRGHCTAAVPGEALCARLLCPVAELWGACKHVAARGLPLAVDQRRRRLRLQLEALAEAVARAGEAERGAPRCPSVSLSRPRPPGTLRLQRLNRIDPCRLADARSASGSGASSRRSRRTVAARPGSRRSGWST
jgi:hypothetical protein